MLETSIAYKEVLLLEHQPDEDPQHAAARDHNDRGGTELRGKTTTVQNVIEGKAPDEYAALAGMDMGVSQLYGLADQRLLNRLFQYAGENVLPSLTLANTLGALDLLYSTQESIPNDSRTLASI